MSTIQTNRKILHAKRSNGRNNSNKTTNVSNHNFPIVKKNDINGNNDRRGEKRKKNLANERLKRLRTALNEDAVEKQPINNNTLKGRHESTSNLQNYNKVNKSANERFKQLQTTLKKGVDRTINGLRCKINRIKTNKRHVDSTDACNLDGKRPNFSTDETVFGFSTTTVGCFNFRKAVDNYSSEEFINSLKRFAEPSTSLQRTNEESMEWSCSDDEDGGYIREPTASIDFTSKLYIVVDSNILISHLDTIKSIIETENTAPPIIVIYIPWIVVEELNYFKDSCLRRKAQDANKYISKMLQEHNAHLIGQSVEEVCQQKNTGKSADDKILACCLQVKQNYNNMVFLTNDINLKLKAQFSSVPVCSYEDILKQLKNAPQTPLNKFQRILDRMTALCATIIRKAAQDAYGNAWKSMDMLKKSPCNMEQCIQIFKKYWFTIFEDLVLKQFMKAIDDLSDFLNARNGDINQLVMLCVRICVYLKDIHNTTDLIETTIREMNEIKNS